MEEEVIKIGQQKYYEGIFTVNTNKVTQIIGNQLDYEIVSIIQVNIMLSLDFLDIKPCMPSKKFEIIRNLNVSIPLIKCWKRWFVPCALFGRHEQPLDLLQMICKR